MSNDPVSRTRRAMLSLSAGSLCTLVGRSAASPQETPELAGAGPSDRASASGTVANRVALAAHRETRIGTAVLLTETLRSGWFVAREKSHYADFVAADPYQAFHVASAVDDGITWIRDYAGPASLDWGGAKGDGVTDDAPYINAMMQNPYVRWFRAEDRRNHFLSSPIRIGHPIKLTGAGMESTTFSVSSPIDVFEASLSGPIVHGLHLADFGVANRMAGVPATAGSGIRLNLVTVAVISNIKIENCYNGVHATRSNLTNVTGIFVNGFRYAGMLFNGGGNFDFRVSGFTISGAQIGSYAIRMDDMCDELIFTDGVCSSSQFALYTSASVYAVNKRPEFCRFSRVSFDSCVNGLDLANCVDFVIDSSFISCRPNHGAQLGLRGPTENIQFIATTFFNNGGSAAIVGGGAIETDFHACKFISNGVAAANTYDTLAFSRGCGDFSVTSSRFRRGWDVAGVPRYHVRIEEAVSGSYQITGNRFSPAGSGILLDERQAHDRQVAANIGL